MTKYMVQYKDDTIDIYDDKEKALNRYEEALNAQVVWKSIEGIYNKKS